MKAMKCANENSFAENRYEIVESLITLHTAYWMEILSARVADKPIIDRWDLNTHWNTKGNAHCEI